MAWRLQIQVMTKGLGPRSPSDQVIDHTPRTKVCSSDGHFFELRARRDALSAQRSSGVARVSYDGKTVEYRSLAEIDRAIEALDREIAVAEGRRIVRQLRVTTTKGL